jgi:hypothetical protein
MKRITLTAPENATREEKAAWVLYPDHATGPKSCQYIHPQNHHRERIIRLASGGYGDVSILSRRQKNEVAEFNRILSTIA